MATASDILRIARAEIGVKESPANSNKVKYNTAYYGRAVSGENYAWCAVFIWWCFRQAGAASLYYGGGKTAYCPTLMSYHKAQAVKGDYQPGDVVFFNFSGGTSAKHVGIVESWDGKTLTTIEGNTGTGNDTNGGAVMRRTRYPKNVVGAYRPAYKEDDDMTYEDWKAYMDRYRQELERKQASAWAKDALKEARAAGITDGKRPRDFATREEVAAMVVNAKKG